MVRFSANLGFLWTELPLIDGIRAAKRAGFDAVECHWPYDTPTSDVKTALAETGLAMLGINTRRGDTNAGDNGVAAIPGREQEARAYIDEAFEYAEAIDCPNVHVMAGRTDKGFAAQSTYIDNLSYAAERAARQAKTVLLEPLNTRDAPGYHLSTLDEALETIAALPGPGHRDRVSIMFDCYHIQIMQGDLLRRLRETMDSIGHIQIAAVHDRGEPDGGELNYKWLLGQLEGLGWKAPVGAEYKPRTTTDEGLAWLAGFR